MKRFILFALACNFSIFAPPLTLSAQDSDLTFPNYVVIGAFAHEKNAITFTDEAKHDRYTARFAMNHNRNLYYVYVLTTADHDYARAEALRLRAETKYFDAWVYSGVFGNIDIATIGKSGGQHDVNPVTGQRLENVSIREQPTLTSHASTVEDTTSDQEQTQAQVSIPVPVRQSTVPLSPEEVVGKNFYFHLYRADNQQMVTGEVDAIDFEKSQKMGTYPANVAVKVSLAGGKMKHISFVCQTFGYRKQQQEFDPESPSEFLYLDDKGNLVIPFELVRLQKGDIAIMYNVFFFKDAAVMRPESRYEVNNLLDLLVENPSYNIVIHGHTNGNASGKIIRMDKPGNFYSLSGTTQGFGSAKKLSEERAIVIREFLISSGISEDRMQVKAWGGKKPLHDKHSTRAHENVRVEIEILSE